MTSSGAAIVSILVLAIMSACAQEPQTQDALGESVAAAAPSTIAQDTLGRLIQRLKTVGGTFTRTGSEHDYRYDGSLEVVRALASFGDSAVARLVQCMDREDTTSTTLEGKAVPLGAMCFDALRRIAYYEATDSEGDIDADWPGYITVAASRAERLRAKDAWEEVVANRSYRIP